MGSDAAAGGLNALADKLDRLIALFNKRGADLPDGLFDRTTQFQLNGVPYENLLGRAPDDPLILILARGPAGYRFVIKSLQHAMPDANVQRGDITWDDAFTVCRGEVWLSGHLRGAGPLEAVLGVELTIGSRGQVERAAVTIDDHVIDQIKAARARA